MNLSLRAVALSLAFSISAFTGATSAKADSFTFSFTNVVGTVNGTVTGEIIGLTNNATGSAAEILITSFPSGLNSIFGSGPINATSWNAASGELIYRDRSGVITAARLLVCTNSRWFRPRAPQLFINGDVGSGFFTEPRWHRQSLRMGRLWLSVRHLCSSGRNNSRTLQPPHSSP